MTGTFNWQKEAKSQWDKRVDFWSERSKTMWDSGSRKDIIPFVQRHLPKGASILDAGCGDGYASYKLQRAGYTVTGMDISSEMIERAKVQTPSISFLQGDAAQIPFHQQTFNALMTINVLEWTEIPANALKEMHRVLKHDGLLFAGILGPTAGPRSNSYRRVYGEGVICNTMMPWEFQQLATEMGFRCIDGFGVFREGVKENHYKGLPLPLKQALTFMWVFALQKEGM